MCVSVCVHIYPGAMVQYSLNWCPWDFIECNCCEWWELDCLYIHSFHPHTNPLKQHWDRNWKKQLPPQELWWSTGRSSVTAAWHLRAWRRAVGVPVQTGLLPRYCCCLCSPEAGRAIAEEVGGEGLQPLLELTAKLWLHCQKQEKKKRNFFLLFLFF